MRPSPLFLAALTLIAGAALAALVISAVGPSAAEQEAATARTVTPLEAPTVAFGNPQRGATLPKLDVVVFGDYQCGPCRELEPALEAMLKAHPEVRLVWKDFPNATSHEHAILAAVAGRCAAEQGAFWQYHAALMGDGADLDKPNLLRRAATMALDELKFSSCLETMATQPTVERDFEEGQRLRIDATPYLFVGTRRISGAVTAGQLDALVTAELAAKSTK
jgi:protein-disulfide isomerase